MGDGGNQVTVIGADTSIKGEMSFESSARVLGRVEGSISAKGELQVAEGGACKADIKASRVMIDGQVEGNVTATDRLELSPKARLTGDIIASKLVVAEGASFSGHCQVGPQAHEPREPKAAAEAEAKPAAVKGEPVEV